MLSKVFLPSRNNFSRKLACLFTFGILLVNMADGQTYVTGTINTNTTWTTAGSPYIITDTVVVSTNDTLRILPGVTVKFNSSALIEIDGYLSANGTSADSIIFTSNSSTPFAGIYNGIQLFSGNFSTPDSLKYCRFSYANAAMHDLVYDNTIITSHCLFTNDLIGIANFSFGSIDTCVFKYDTFGISSLNSTVVLGCEFTQNHVGLYGGGGPTWIMSNCTFSNNQYGCYEARTSKIEYSTFYSNEYAITQYEGDTTRNCIIQYNNIGIISEGSDIELNDISDNAIGIETCATPYHDPDTLKCNTICNNTTWNIVAEMPSTYRNISASDNYWCLPDSAHIQATIYDIYQNSSLGYVFFTPFNTMACSDVPTAIKELPPITSSITLFPNPNNGSFTIQSSVASGQSSVEIYNSLGQMIYNSNIAHSTSQIRLNNPSTGVYLYRIISENGNLLGTGKFVVE